MAYDVEPAPTIPPDGGPASPPSPIQTPPAEPKVLIGIEQLKGSMCRWPIGDPAAENFTFCGKRKKRGAYCDDHADVGYQQLHGRKKH